MTVKSKMTFFDKKNLKSLFNKKKTKKNKNLFIFEFMPAAVKKNTVDDVFKEAVGGPYFLAWLSFKTKFKFVF